MAEGTPTGIAWAKYIKHCRDQLVRQTAAADEKTILKLQGKLQLFNEMETLPITIKRNTENG